MQRNTLLAAGLLLGAYATSCQSGATSGTAIPVGTVCPEGQVCDPNNPNNNNTVEDPFNLPPTSGTVAVGSSASPYTPTSPGSSAVKVENNAVVLDSASFGKELGTFVWVANSADGTESKVDAATGLEVARYCTGPGCKQDPSRSTVSLLGDVAVTNRANYYGYAFPDRASVVKIAGNKARCVDRNGNGKIDTFEGAGPVPAEFMWPAGQQFSPDECVLWHTPLTKDRNGVTTPFPGTLPRAAAFDSTISPTGEPSQYLYVGLYTPGEVVRLDSATGQILKQFSVGVATYGFVMDKNGRLWIQGSGTLVSVDVKGNDAVTNYGAKPCMYGITADSRGLIYTTFTGCVMRFNPLTNVTERFDITGQGRGLALDDKYNLWVATDGNGLTHIDASAAPAAVSGPATMVFKQLVNLPAPRDYLGVGLDANRNPWVVNEANAEIYKVNPTDYSSVRTPVGTNPYTYSDITGSALRYAGARFGLYRHTFKSDCAPRKTTWTQVSYAVDTPAGTTVEVSARGAGTPQLVETTAFGPTTTIPPAQAGPITPSLNEGADNTYLQVQFKLTADDPTKTPAVKDLVGNYTCS
jgi:hypothetical protein